MNNAPYAQYVHTLSMAYRQFGIETDFVVSSINESDACALGALAVGRPPTSELSEAPFDPASYEKVSSITRQIRRRLGRLPGGLGDQLLDEPLIRSMTFEGDRGAPVPILIPIINPQGAAWYAESPPANFDFTVEQSAGLLDGARTIYDFGAHHGVWSAFYSLRAGGQGLVWAFEPSILNVEVSALLFLLNGISNVVNVAAAVGATTGHVDHAREDGLLVDFVDDVHVIDLSSVAWRKADFLKMDIEGFEYDILTAYPWVFDLATNMHIELHVPHLEHRGLDYRDVIAVLPFEQFDVRNYQRGVLTPIDADSPLSGYCSLLMKRRAD